MPLVNISLIKGNSRELKEMISLEIHDALVDIFNIDDSDFNHRIYEFDRDNWQLPHDKSDSYVLIEIEIFPGRTKEMKKNLFAEIIKRLSSLKIPVEDVFIVLKEHPLDNWGIRGGIQASELY